MGAAKITRARPWADGTRSAVLLVGEYPTQRASIARYLRKFDVLELATFADVPRRSPRDLRGIIALVQEVSDLDRAPAKRTHGAEVPMLVIAPSAHAAIANRAQLLDAQCLFGADIDVNIRAFVARLPDARRERPRAPEEVAARYANGIGLSRRQHELLVHVAAGVRRDQLAQAMGASEATIKTIARHVLRRLGARRIDELAVAMLRGESAKPARSKPTTAQRSARRVPRSARDDVGERTIKAAARPRLRS